MLISLSELPDSLRAHVAALRTCVRRALEDFAADHNALRYRYSTRTEASLIHDYMVWHAKQSSFSSRLRRNLFLLEVANDYRVKLKKLNGQFRANNIPTFGVGVRESAGRAATVRRLGPNESPAGVST